jgi:DNA-binding NtrC family response regulator
VSDPTPARILIVEDELTQAKGLQGLLELEGLDVGICETGGSAVEQALEGGWDLILSDLRLPDMDGLEVHRKVREAQGDGAPTFVILTAYGTVESAREALKAGVYDYLTKPVDPTELTFMVRVILDKRRLRRENLVRVILDKRRLRRENLELIQQMASPCLEERLIGESPSFLGTIDLARNAGQSQATILIRGESGTGKELVAELIHEASPRRDGAFVKVNCGAIPEALLEAELFGHEQGAFTDARKSRKGRFELADGGTIFLDEIGEMSPAIQVKLLRVLQERQLERLGGQGKVIELDIRLVAATNRDLETMVAEGTFREDLYYRINVITVKLPPLRERPGDVELLAKFFCRRFTQKNGKDFRGLSPPALEYLRQHDWPGNVRELENVIERAVVLGHGEWLEPDHLIDLHKPKSRPASSQGRIPSRGELVDQVLESQIDLDTFERTIIRQALARSEGNVSQAARILGLTRRTLQYRMEKHGVRKEAVGR